MKEWENKLEGEQGTYQCYDVYVDGKKIYRVRPRDIKAFCDQVLPSLILDTGDVRIKQVG